MKKILLVVVGILCILFIVISTLIDGVVKKAITARVNDTLGMEVTIDEVNVGLLGANIRIDGLKIVNSEDFGNKDFITIPLLYVDTKLGALLGGDREIDEIKLHIADVGIVKNSSGELNLSRLKAMAPAKEKNTDDASEKQGGVGVGQFSLTFGQLTFWDFSKGGDPEELVIPVRISHQTFKDVTSMQQVGQAVVIAAVLEGTAREGGMDEIFFLGDEIKSLGGPEMSEKLDEFKAKFNAPGKGGGM